MRCTTNMASPVVSEYGFRDASWSRKPWTTATYRVCASADDHASLGENCFFAVGWGEAGATPSDRGVTWAIFGTSSDSVQSAESVGFGCQPQLAAPGSSDPLIVANDRGGKECVSMMNSEATSNWDAS